MVAAGLIPVWGRVPLNHWSAHQIFKPKQPLDSGAHYRVDTYQRLGNGCNSQTRALEPIVSCPQCAERGASVELRAVKALLTEEALARLECVGHRFCRTSTCAVVYYDEFGRTHRIEDIRVRVWHKEPFGHRLLCYCFGETESTIREELRRGPSQAVSRIRAHIDAGRCACDVRNPRGVCCLGDLTLAVQRVKAELAPIG